VEAFTGDGIAPDEMAMIEICRRMQWDYATYRQQPSWYLAHLNAYEIAQQKAARQIQRKQNGKH